MKHMELTIGEMTKILHTSIRGPLAQKLASRKVSLSTDSRSIRKNQVFWALAGERFDGHDYVDACLAAGACAAVVNRNWYRANSSQEYPCLPVVDSTKALLTLGRAYADKFRIPKITLTGSNGKTTTKDMLMHILSRRGKVLGTRGNLNNHIGVPLTLFGLNLSYDYAVIELGTNHPGEIRALARAVGADIGILTNIGYSHTEHFGSLTGVFREKKNITAGFHRRSVLVINADDKYLARLEANSPYRVITFGIHQGAMRARNVRLDPVGCASFILRGVRFRLRVPGIHNVYNALAALSVGRLLKIPFRTMAQALNGFRASSRRLEISSMRGIRIYDDCYNANPLSMQAAIEILGKTEIRGRTYAVLGEMWELGTEEIKLHRQVGEKVAEYNIDELFALGKLARHMCEGARARGMRAPHIHHYLDIGKLNRNLSRKLMAGDAVLVKGSRAMRMERVTAYLKKVRNV
jgi:UDP-N-acetylmuramoyl-tripeptide--D-alanyl-D-alanine ligase